MRRTLYLLSFIVAGLVGVSLLHPTLESWHRQLGLIQEVPEDLPEALKGEGDSPNVAVLGATLGVFRPMVIHLLWLRSYKLKREGRFFESASLARGITALQPRLPQVWVFQARTLAFDISGESPIDDRFRWVVEAIELLRDRGLSYNPTSPRLYDELSYLFLFKIGQRLDEAHHLYKKELARTFEPPPGLSGRGLSTWRAEVLARWKIDAPFAERLAAKVLGDTRPPGGAEAGLDFRLAESHALYWAEIGLGRTGGKGDRAAMFRLRQYRLLALEKLLKRGFLVRQPGGSHHAGVPDLRFRHAVRKALEEEVRIYEERVARLHGSAEQQLVEVEQGRLQDSRDELQQFHALTVFCFLIWNRRDDARAWLDENGEHLVVEDLDTFLLDVMMRGGESAGESVASLDRGSVLRLLAGLLSASIHLRRVEERDVSEFAGGIHRLAGLVHARWGMQDSERGALPALEDLHRSLREGKPIGIIGEFYLPPIFDQLETDLHLLDPQYGREAKR